RHLARAQLGSLLRAGDLVVANDAATLPASLHGAHCTSRQPIEVRLAAWVSLQDPTRFAAIAFGAGDHRTRTEDRMLPPPMVSGGPLALRPAGGGRRALTRPPPPVQAEVSGESRNRPGRACPTWAADPIRARPRAAGLVGCLDKNCGRPDCTR